jgi:hypothetical protein
MSAVNGYEGQFAQVDDLLLHLKGLVLVRELLEQRGASSEELREHTQEIDRLRVRLAEVVRETGGGAMRAAA